MIHVVYHAGGLGHWRPIVREQFSLLARVGLHRIHATHVGEGLDWFLDESVRHGLDLVLAEHQDDVEQWECPAIRLVERLARTGDTPVLYLHTKGASHDPVKEPVFHEWRRLMHRELVAKWCDHVPALESHDAVGVNWWKDKTHFSGNFWLAAAAWLRKLPRFDGYYRDRYSCERWIGSVPGCRVKSLFCSDKRLWDLHSRLIGVET